MVTKEAFNRCDIGLSTFAHSTAQTVPLSIHELQYKKKLAFYLQAFSGENGWRT
jgi:hypothetical protein